MTKRVVFVWLFVMTISATDDALADIYIDTHQTDAFVISSQPQANREYIQLTSPSIDNQTLESQPSKQLPYHQEVIHAAIKTQLDPALIHAVIAAESSHNPKAISSKGAAGLMQLMPKTAKKFGVQDIFDPKQNILAGSQYLSDLNKVYQGNIELMLAAYNAGPANVRKHGGKVPPYQETQRYVPRVLKLYKHYRKQLQPIT